ncbi:MAG: hypothetical protein FWG15_02570 [Propionibacteriaceae bacterium]|nr:hypothetical protein [Propionibacteriaceae bacterium]
MPPMGGYTQPTPGYGQAPMAYGHGGGPSISFSLPASIQLPEIMLMVMAGAGLIGFIATFLPVYSFYGFGLGFFSLPGVNFLSAIVLLLGFLAVIVLALMVLFMNMGNLKFITGIVAASVGGLAVIAFIGYLIYLIASGVASFGASVGAGLIMLLIFGLVVCAAGIVLLVAGKTGGFPKAPRMGQPGTYMPPMGGAPQGPGIPPAAPMAPPAAPVAPPTPPTS